MVVTTTATQRKTNPKMAVAILAGALVAVALGVYGETHNARTRDTFSLFFSSMISFKVWCTTLVLFFGVIQVFSSLRLYGRLKWPKREPSWLAPAHRLSGTFALLFSLPVAYHCLWSLGFNGGHADTRVLVHSIAGCAFYGAYVTKVSFVRMDRLPGIALPIAGGLTFALLTVIWLSSSLWFLSENKVGSWF